MRQFELHPFSNVVIRVGSLTTNRFPYQLKTQSEKYEKNFQKNR